MSQPKKQILSLQRRQQMLYIGLFSLVTIVVWVSVSLLQSQRNTQIPAELKKKALPLTPSINQQVIRQIESKRSYSERDLAEFPIFKLILTREGGEDLVTIDTPEPNLRQAPPTPEPTEEPTPEQDVIANPTPEPTPITEPLETQPATESGTAT